MPSPFCLRFAIATGTVVAGVLASNAASAQDAPGYSGADDRPPPAPPVLWLDSSKDAEHDTTVVVHMNTPESVELQRRDTNGEWRPVCSSPCDRPLAEHRQYRVAGEGVRPSAELTLEGHGERISLEARPSSSGWFTGGIVLVSTGGAFLATGVFVATVVASLQGVAGAAGAGDQSDSASTVRVGIVLIVVGAAAVATGIVAIVSNRSTGVFVQGAPPPRDSNVAPTRGAIWGDPSKIEAALPAVNWMPLFTTRF
jgi:hypothetical protein